jgi:hypothetical protein
MGNGTSLGDAPRTRRAWLRAAGAVGLGAIGATAAGVAAAGPAAAAGAAFFPITYRSFDSRFSGGPISYNESGDLDLITDQGGNTVLPATTVAVAYNLTITQTVSPNGFLALWPAGTGYPGNSSINWFAPNMTLANGGIVSLGTSGQTGPGSVTVLCLGVPSSRTQFIIDVTGYYQ